MIDKAVPSIMLSHAGLTALIGTRVLPLTLGDKTSLPAVTYQKISDVRGPAGTGTRIARFQISCIAKTLLEAKEVVAQVQSAFDRQHRTVSGVQVFDSDPEDDYDEYDEETKLCRVPVDILVKYKV
ncbi:MAG: DUF3168 domain-containing protein [Clostridia bacterium]|nr:DUF3168 domain-containing protein [Clostridia bacterium]